MSRDVSGNYSLPGGTNVTFGQKPIQSATWNAAFNDVAASLTDSLSRSGKGAMQANLAMGGFSITGAAAGTFSGALSAASIDLTGAVTAATMTLSGAAVAASFAGAGGSLTGLNATQLTTGTIPDARFPATLPAASGANLTALNAAALATGQAPVARLGTGTPSTATFLRGDGAWSDTVQGHLVISPTGPDSGVSISASRSSIMLDLNNTNPGGRRWWWVAYDSATFSSHLSLRDVTAGVHRLVVTPTGRFRFSGASDNNTISVEAGGASIVGNTTLNASGVTGTALTVTGTTAGSGDVSVVSAIANTPAFTTFAFRNAHTSGNASLTVEGQNSVVRVHLAAIGTTGSVGLASNHQLDFRTNNTVRGTFSAAGDLSLLHALTVTGTISGPGSGITALNAANLASGIVPDARFPATLPAVSGANLTNLNGSNIASGTVAVARLGSGTPTESNFLRGDGTWQSVAGVTAGAAAAAQLFAAMTLR